MILLHLLNDNFIHPWSSTQIYLILVKILKANICTDFAKYYISTFMLNIIYLLYKYLKNCYGKHSVKCCI